MTSPTPSDSRVKVVWHRPWVADYQAEAIFCPQRYSLVEATTKSGKTVGCMIWLFEQALQGPRGSQYWWVAPTIKQAEIAFRRYTLALRRMRGFENLPGPLFRANRSKPPYLTLFNGVTMSFMSGEHPDNLYGEDVRAAVLDEASRMREEAWHAIRSTLTATGGPVRIIGNVKGRRNWFYTMCRKAEAQQDLPEDQRTMHYSVITANDAIEAGILKQEEIDDAREQLPEMIFRELYFAEPGDDEGNPFGMQHIRVCIEPLSGKKPKVWGWDLGRAQDWTVGIALDEDRRVCRYVRFQKPWDEQIRLIREHTGRVRAYVDKTGLGDVVIAALQRGGGGNFRGYHFTSSSKQPLMEGLAIAIQSGDIAYPDGQIVKELESFEYEYTRTGVRYQAMPGNHDDCVCALALANHGLARRAPRINPDDVDYGEPTVEVYYGGEDYPTLADEEF